MLIVHVCSLWYCDSVKVNYCFIVLGIRYHFVKKETYSKYNKTIIHFYRMRIPESAYMYN